MTAPAPLGPDDVYVHVADDGGIFVSPADRRLSAWVTLDDLRTVVAKVERGPGALYLSTESGSWLGAPAVQLVMDSGATIMEMEAIAETKREGGVTALIAAAGVGAVGLLDDLLARHADVEQREDLGRTALMVAASRGETTTLRHLIDAGANLDATDHRGASSLILAAYFGHGEAARLLIDAGADPAIRDRSGKDAQATAEAQGRSEVAAQLPASPSGPLRSRDRLRFLRSKPVLTDGPDELVVRTFDAAVLRAPGIVVAVLLVIIGAATGKAAELGRGALTGVVVLALFWGLGWFAGRQGLRVRGTTVQTRFPLRWKAPVDLDHVVAAHYIPRLRSSPALQLLQADRGSLHPAGGLRWQGVTPKPTGPDGEALRCYVIPLGAASSLVLDRVAPVLLGRDVTLDSPTRAQLESHRH